MIKDNSVNPLCLKHAPVEIVVLCESVVGFVPVGTNLSCLFMICTGEVYVSAS